MKIITYKKSAGFTLIELVLVIMIVSIVAVIGSKIMGQGLRAYLDFQNMSAADWQMRVALETMTREIRNLRYPSDITATQFSFVDNNGKSVSFSLSGTSLMENSQILADGVTAMTFTYYNSSILTTTTPSAIILVELDITFNNNNTLTTTQLFWFPRNTIA
jgi:prepilin-type N-terminal cleavage/methylation domain-containing protein